MLYASWHSRCLEDLKWMVALYTYMYRVLKMTVKVRAPSTCSSAGLGFLKCEEVIWPLRCTCKMERYTCTADYIHMHVYTVSFSSCYTCRMLLIKSRLWRRSWKPPDKVQVAPRKMWVVTASWRDSLRVRFASSSWSWMYVLTLLQKREVQKKEKAMKGIT